MHVGVVVDPELELEAGSKSSTQTIGLNQELLFVVYHPGREELTKRGDPSRVCTHELEFPLTGEVRRKIHQHFFRIVTLLSILAAFLADLMRLIARDAARGLSGFRRRLRTHLLPLGTNVPSRRK